VDASITDTTPEVAAGFPGTFTVNLTDFSTVPVEVASENIIYEGFRTSASYVLAQQVVGGSSLIPLANFGDVVFDGGTLNTTNAFFSSGSEQFNLKLHGVITAQAGLPDDDNNGFTIFQPCNSQGAVANSTAEFKCGLPKLKNPKK